MAPKVIVITGPTATGKSALGVALAQRLNGEIVSADSMQIYRGMDIGTAKVTERETGGIPHHMIDVADPGDDYSVSRYVDEAAERCDDILARGKVPIIVGGTGLYIESLISGRDFAPRGDNTLREKYSHMYDELGGETLLQLLAERDALRAEKLHPNDKKRIVRALESAELGASLSEHDEMTQTAPARYDAAYIVLNFADRQTLYARIDARVDDMLAQGLEAEVKALLASGLTSESTAMQAIGYKEMCAAISGRCTISEAVEEIKLASRRYAKRQISWCKRYPDALWINWEKIPDIAEGVHVSTAFSAERGII